MTTPPGDDEGPIDPRLEQEVLEWIEGFAGKRQPQPGTSFDRLDARVAANVRKEIEQSEAQISEFDVARVQKRLAFLTLLDDDLDDDPSVPDEYDAVPVNYHMAHQERWIASPRIAAHISFKEKLDAPTRSDGVGRRTDEEIEIVLDRVKWALYRIYARELRSDPTLRPRWQVVLRLTIEPGGSVSECVVQSSDMNAPALESRFVERVKTFAFDARDVPAITVVYPIDFPPKA